MPAKKAAKKVAAKHADPKHPERKDLRRAYEHLGRVQALQPLVKGELSQGVATLVALAEAQLQQGRRKEAADLLRAAEHFSFAALAGVAANAGQVSAELKDTVGEEVEHLAQRAQDHWAEAEDEEHHPEVATLFQGALTGAEAAVRAGSYRQALELSRGAEALAHVKTHGPERLQTGSERLELQTA